MALRFWTPRELRTLKTSWCAKLCPKKDVSSWLKQDASIMEDQLAGAEEALLAECFVTKIQGLGSSTSYRVIGSDMRAFANSDQCNAYFLKIALASDAKLLQKMAEVAFGADDYSFFTALLHLFPEQELFNFLCGFLKRSINQSLAPSEVLRADYVETVLFRAWCANNWAALTSQAMKSVVMHATCVPQSLQLKQDTMAFPSMYQGNVHTVRQVCEELLQEVVRVLGTLPPFAQLVCAHVRDLMAKKFPHDASAGTDAVATLLVLRGISPALVSPHIFNLAPTKPSTEVRTSLMTIARIVQQVCTGSPFSADSEFAVVNDLIEKWAPLLVTALADIGKDASSVTLSTTPPPLVRHACIAVSKRLKWHNVRLMEKVVMKPLTGEDELLSFSNQKFAAVCGRLLFRFADGVLPLKSKKPSRPSKGEGDSSEDYVGGMHRSNSNYSFSMEESDDMFCDNSAEDYLAKAKAAAEALREKISDSQLAAEAQTLLDLITAAAHESTPSRGSARIV